MIGEGYDVAIVWYNDKPSLRFLTWYEGDWYAAELPMRKVNTDADADRSQS